MIGALIKHLSGWIPQTERQEFRHFNLTFAVPPEFSKEAADALHAEIFDILKKHIASRHDTNTEGSTTASDMKLMSARFSYVKP